MLHVTDIGHAKSLTLVISDFFVTDTLRLSDNWLVMLGPFSEKTYHRLLPFGVENEEEGEDEGEENFQVKILTEDGLI